MIKFGNTEFSENCALDRVNDRYRHVFSGWGFIFNGLSDKSRIPRPFIHPISGTQRPHLEVKDPRLEIEGIGRTHENSK